MSIHRAKCDVAAMNVVVCPHMFDKARLIQTTGWCLTSLGRIVRDFHNTIAKNSVSILAIHVNTAESIFVMFHKSHFDMFLKCLDDDPTDQPQ